MKRKKREPSVTIHLTETNLKNPSVLDAVKTLIRVMSSPKVATGYIAERRKDSA